MRLSLQSCQYFVGNTGQWRAEVWLQLFPELSRMFHKTAATFWLMQSPQRHMHVWGKPLFVSALQPRNTDKLGTWVGLWHLQCDLLFIKAGLRVTRSSISKHMLVHLDCLGEWPSSSCFFMIREALPMGSVPFSGKAELGLAICTGLKMSLRRDMPAR